MLVSQDTFIKKKKGKKKNTNWICQFISQYSIVYLPLLYVKDKGRNQIEEKGKLLSPQMSNSSSTQFSGFDSKRQPPLEEGPAQIRSSPKYAWRMIDTIYLYAGYELFLI